ncbi:7401_t:CDS:2 [Ambispora gerdemannii]|uniref:Histone H1 n=1 Tax=Ambispora gerdemannii TaxID=144530 RepID=A0A9N8YNA5_9GLOM|nr:7401_t:CDS:2 [Ambispora gerdemannii]
MTDTETALTTLTIDKSITDFEPTTGLQTPDKSDQHTSESDQQTPRSMINTRSPDTNNSNGTRSPNTSKGSGANGEEWGDEDGDFELEDDISPTSQASRDISLNTNLEVNNNLSATPSFPTPPETINVEVVAQIETSSILDDTDANQLNSDHLTANESNTNQQQPGSHHEELITKFGRKVSKPVHYSPNAPKPSRGSKTTNKTTSKSTKKSSTKSSGSSKRQRREPSPVVAEDVLCSICQEGQSPKHNRIVLCDSCDTPFHQQCHVPNIDDYVTEVRDASWYCLKCENEKQANKKRKIESSDISNQLSTGVTGKDYTEGQKKQYLQSLSSDTLVKLLLFAETLHPDLPIYPHNFKDIVDTSQTPHPVPEVVIDSTDQARAIEAQSNVNLSSSSGSVPARSSISPTPTPSASTVQSNLPSQFSPMHEKSFSIPRHHSYLSTTSQEQPSAMHAHLPPSTTLIQAPQSSTFAFSLTTLSTSPNTIRAPQSLLPSPTTANLPSYEEMIVEAIGAIADQNGSPPKTIFDKMESTYPLHAKFRSSASQALHKAVKKGRVLKVGLTLYKLNSDYTAPAKNGRRLHRKTSVASSISDTHSVTSAILTNYNGYDHNKDNEVVSSPNAVITDDSPSNMDIDSKSNAAGVGVSEAHQERSMSAFAAYNGGLPRPQTLTQLPPTLPPLSSVAGTAYMPFPPGNGYNGGHVGALH